jgi:hypothetical protein
MPFTERAIVLPQRWFCSIPKLLQYPEDARRCKGRKRATLKVMTGEPAIGALLQPKLRRRQERTDPLSALTMFLPSADQSFHFLRNHASLPGVWRDGQPFQIPPFQNVLSSFHALSIVSLQPHLPDSTFLLTLLTNSFYLTAPHLSRQIESLVLLGESRRTAPNDTTALQHRSAPRASHQ